MTPQEAAEQYTNKLLPCPLCNGQPGEHVFFAGYMAPGNYQAKCTQCHLIVSQDRIDKVIGIWNQRCFMPSQLSSALKEIAELHAKVKDLQEALNSVCTKVERSTTLMIYTEPDVEAEINKSRKLLSI